MTADRARQDVSPPQTLCEPFVAQSDVTGASIAVFDSAGRQSTVCASDAVAARIDEVQFELGHGPQEDVVRSGQPVAIPDVSSATLPAGFGVELERLQVAALFALPLLMGAAVVGVVSLYRDRPGALSSDDLRVIVGLTAVTASTAVRQALTSAQSDHGGHPAAAGPEMRREVHQATGMLIIHLDVDATEAFARLRAHAFASGRPLATVARDVVAGTLDFRALD